MYPKASMLVAVAAAALAGKLAYPLEQKAGFAPSPLETVASADTKSILKTELRHSLPLLPDQPFPKLLSDTGVFSDLKQLSVADGLLPYDLNAPFWSDGAAKRRWISIRRSTEAPITFSPTGEWKFPTGTVFVKHFEMPMEIPMTKPLRLETRILLRSPGDGVHGATYRWRADRNDADLVEAGISGVITTSSGCGEKTEQEWYYPGRQDCQVCHTSASGGVLGVNARQLNRTYSYDGTNSENQLVDWSRMGILNPAVSSRDIPAIPALTPVDDQQATVEHRVRSYLDVNCAMCHQPGIDSGYFDARFDTPLVHQHLVGGNVKINLGIDNAEVVSAHDPWRSTLLTRIATIDPGITMPPLGHHRVDTAAVDLIRRWIVSMPGEDVLPPPHISPGGGEYTSWPVVTMYHDDSQATVRYTITGAPPNEHASAYSGPIHTTGPVTIRARAFKPGARRSIIVTETYTQP